MLLKVTRAGRVVRTVQPRDGEGDWFPHRDVNEHPRHKQSVLADLTAEALGFGREAREVDAAIAAYLPSQTRVRLAGPGLKGTAQGRQPPVLDLAGVSLKVREVKVKGGKHSQHLTVLREQSARGLFTDLANLADAGRDIAVVTLLLPRVGDCYVLAEEEVRFSLSFPFREFARTGWDASIARGRGHVGRPKKGEVLPETWLSHDAGTDCTGGSWLFYGRHPHTHKPDEWAATGMSDLGHIIGAQVWR